MPRLITREEKNNKIQTKIEHIKNLYNLIFERKISYLNLKDFKKVLSLDKDCESFVANGKIILKQIKLFQQMIQVYPEFEELKDVEMSLKVVYSELVSVLKKEFRIARTEFRVVEIN